MRFRLPLVAAIVGPLAAFSPLAQADGDKAAIGSVNLSVASVTAPDDSLLFEPGFGFQLHMPYYEVGMQFEFSEAQLVGGTRDASNYIPVVGTHLETNHDQKIIAQAYTQLRLPFQTRDGAGMPGRTGLGLGAEAGGRIWFCKTELHGDESEAWQGWCFGASMGLRYQHHLSDFQMGSAVLPEGSGTFSLPFVISFGLNPRSMN